MRLAMGTTILAALLLAAGAAAQAPADGGPATRPAPVVPAPAAVPVAAPAPVAAPPATAAAPPVTAAPALAPAPASAPPATVAPAPASSRTAPPPAAHRKAQRGEEAMRAGDWRGALFAWQEAANLDPANPVYRLKLGETYEQLGYWAEAARQYDLAAALDPPGAEALHRAERARVAARAGAPPPPSTPAPPPPQAQTPAAAPYEAGVALIAQGKYAEALASLDEAVRRDPRLPVAYTARASALFGLARYVESAGDYRTALALEPGSATPLFGLGECYRLLGQPGPAADYYARYVASTAPDARDDLRTEAQRRLVELGR